MMRGRLLFATSLGGLVGYAIWRPRMARWGATLAEYGRPLPGDELFPNTRIISTRVIDIGAPPAVVWPWLLQMGHGRAGFYSHDWLERLLGTRPAGGRSATRILPQFQQLAEGDRVPYHPLLSVPVLRLQAPWVLVAGEWFVLEEREGGRATRLFVRTRGGWLEAAARDAGVPGLVRLLGGLVDRLIGEPLHHYMEVAMLKGIKARVEAAAGTPLALPSQIVESEARGARGEARLTAGLPRSSDRRPSAC